MDYTMEELVPLVAELAESYTSSDSTSITWEKAEQFMEAVLYCIHELENAQADAVIPWERTSERISAQQAYRAGLKSVEKKARTALKMYNEILPDFSCYGNRCLYDTVVKGLPEFFKWYDIRYEPQNTILTLDYPVLADLSGYTGIDRIYEYILCIRLEQKFLSRFPEEYVQDVLLRYNRSYKDMIENICEIVLTEIVRCLLLQKPVVQQKWNKEDGDRLRNLLLDKSTEEILRLLNREVREFFEKYFKNCRELCVYLEGSVRDIVFRLKTAAVDFCDGN